MEVIHLRKHFTQENLFITIMVVIIVGLIISYGVIAISHADVALLPVIYEGETVLISNSHFGEILEYDKEGFTVGIDTSDTENFLGATIGKGDDSYIGRVTEVHGNILKCVYVLESW